MSEDFCANWQAADDAELELGRYPNIEFILQRTPAGSTTPVAAAALAEADAVINYSATQHLGASPAEFKTAKIAVRAGVGFDNLDLAGWGAKGVPVCNVPDYGTTEVADHALGLMLSLTRGTSAYAPSLIAGGPANWHFRHAPLVRRHRGAVFGVIGLGRIGLAAARRAAAFDMKVVFFDPHLESGVDLSTGYDRVHSLDALMSIADVVSVHAPLSDETRNLLDAKAFAAATPGLIVINTARGPIIDLDALEAALREGKIAGAGIDVLPHEPQDMDHPLFAAWRKGEPWIAGRLMVTPHAAFYSPASMIDLRLKSVEVVHALLVEGRLTNCVNRQFLGQGAVIIAVARQAATPYARRLARERGLALEAIVGSGPGGRIVAADVEAHVARPAAPVASAAGVAVAVSALATTIDVANLRKLLADFASAGIALTIDDMVARSSALALEVMPTADPGQVAVAWETGANSSRREILLPNANRGPMSALHGRLAAGLAGAGTGTPADPPALSVRRLRQSGIRPVAMPLLPGYRMRLIVSADDGSGAAECLLCFDAGAIGEDDAAGLLARFRQLVETPLLLLA